ncbi:MAG: GNAT family N-acetyltransferase [Bacteroidales bacterium]|nr:GNAT family N-acetyltransferase [Bacteroidales bacterium]
MIYDKIKLRAPEPEDLAILYEWENDPGIWQISNTLSPFSKYILRKYIENSSKSVFETGQLRFMIDIIATGKTIGTIDLFDFDPFHLRAGVGVLIADVEERRKGYAEMSIRCLANYCFNHLKLHQLYCNITEDNKPSVALFTKIGFVEIGRKKEWIRDNKGFVDEIMFQMFNPGN